MSLALFLLFLLFPLAPGIPAAGDLDNDGLPDLWETHHFGGTAAGPNDDPDDDGLTNLEEYREGTLPLEADTDADGLGDGQEVGYYLTDPLMSDTDCGGRSDGEEAATRLNPNSPSDDAVSHMSITLKFHAGWNMFSLPLSPDNSSIDTLLAPISDTFESVWRYQNGVWNAYYNGNILLSDFSELEAGKGYWIKMNSPASITISGIPSDNPIPLSTGWNLVGFSGTVSQPPDTAFIGILPALISAWTYNSIAGEWEFYGPDSILSDLETIRPGGGYWLRIDSPCIW